MVSLLKDSGPIPYGFHVCIGKSMGIMIMSPTMVNVIQTRWLRYALLLQIKCSLWAEVLL
jgi:hypothetical protein